MYRKCAIELYMFVFCLLFVSFLQAQTITKSYPDKVASRFSDYEIVGKNDAGILVHYFGNNESELVAYNDKLRIEDRVELPFKGKSATLEKIILQKDKILIFYTTQDDNYQYIKLKTADKQLNLSPFAYVIDSMPVKNIGKGRVFYVKPSADNSKILVFNMLQTSSSYFIRFTILNDSIKILNRNLFSMQDVKDVALKSIKINNKGNVFAVVGKESRVGNNDYNYDTYTSFVFNRETNTISEQVLQNENYVFKNLITEVSNRRDIGYIAACYRNTQNKNDIGIFYQIIDFRTNTVLLNTKMPFSDKILEKSQTMEYKSWQDKATLVKPKRIIPRSDGGIILVTEGEYKFTKAERMEVNNFGYYNAVPLASSLRYIDQNFFYDIGIFSINLDGTVDWQATLPKAQVSENDDGYYSSFTFFEANNVLKFLFNEDFYNIGNFVEYSINPNGLVKRQSVMNSEKQNLVMVPLKAKQLDGNDIIFPSEQKRTLQFVLFHY